MVQVGVVGLGLMGQTHLGAYAQLKDATVVAVADRDEALLHGRRRAEGSFEGQADAGYDLSGVRKYTDGMDLIRDPDVQLVDLCLATPLHVAFAVAALEAGKHVLIEKPLARSSRDARAILDAEAKAPGLAMCAQCMRFWPGWDWLKRAVDDKRFGAVRSASFTRLGRPAAAPFYRDGTLSGGAVLDLHVHDTDFIHHLFGPPRRVTSVGYSAVSGCVDHLSTFYHYDDVPHVTAEGGWVDLPDYPFTIRYHVVFERAAAIYDHALDKPLTLIESGKAPAAVELPAGLGYEPQIAYFLDCIRTGRAPARSSLHDAARSLCILEAETQSVQTGLGCDVGDLPG